MTLWFVCACALTALSASDPSGVEAIDTGESWAYWVETTPDSRKRLLINTGADAKAEKLLARLDAKHPKPIELVGILLTDGRREEAAGLSHLAHVGARMHQADILLAMGLERPRAWGAWARWRVDRPSRAKFSPEAFDFGSPLTVGEAKIEGVRLPGRTAGSAAFVYRDTIFVGGLKAPHTPESKLWARLWDDAPADRDMALTRMCRTAKCAGVRFVASSFAPIAPVASWCP